MKLIKRNHEKKRSVYYTGTTYIKKWDDATSEWTNEHVKLLKELVPGYVIEHGDNWIEYNEVNGTLASTVPHTDDYCKVIYDYCKQQIESTKPYAHGDWVLSNMIITDRGIRMIDWDNLGIYDETLVKEKLERDLISAFGKERFDRIK